MATTAPAIRLGAVRPEEAVGAFTERGLLQPTFRWQDVWQQEHARAFAVAGVARLDILQAFRDGIDEAVKTGLNPQDFRARMQTMLEARGFWGNVTIKDPATGQERTTRFDQARLQLIYDVNLRQSYAAGRWEAIQRNKKRMPYLVYRTMRDERVRASHKPWDGLALPVDHAFWQTHYPPNGWRCRCTAFAASEKDLQRMRDAGLPVKTEAPPDQWLDYTNPYTGEITPVPRGVDPGFAYNPGMARGGGVERDAELFDQALRKAAQAPAAAGAEVMERAMADHPGLLAAKAASFRAWALEVLRRKQDQGDVVLIGTLPPATLRALKTRGVEPETSVVAVRDADVLHAGKARKGERAADPELYAQLPVLLDRATGILLQRGVGDAADALLYIVDSALGDGSVAKIVVKVDYRVKQRSESRGAGGRVRVAMNLVRTVTVIDPQALGDTKQFELLWGVRP